MNNNIDINYPVGAFEDIKDFDLKEFGDVENPSYYISPYVKEKMTNLAGCRLENACRLLEDKDYDAAIEITKSALWLLEIISKREHKQ